MELSSVLWSIIEVLSACWPQIVAGLISLILAWFTALKTSKNEALKQCRDKRLAAYDEAIEFLDEFRVHPEIAFEDDFYLDSLKLSNHLRAYGSTKVVNAFRDVMQTLHVSKKEYDFAITDLRSRYMPIKPVYDGEGRLDHEEEVLLIDMEEFEIILEKEKTRRTMTGKQTIALLEPVFKAISKSISSRWG